MGYSGYKQIYMPDYYCATKMGFVAEHRYVAEQKLGRHLKKGEVVHHIDRNRLNNDPDNLLVFRSRQDHSRYHNGGTLIEMEDGTYISTNEKPQIVCAYCGKLFTPLYDTTKYCCKECCTLASRRVKRPTKSELKNLLLQFSMVQIAEIYGITDNGIRRWCIMYKLPYRLKDIKKLREKEKLKTEERAKKEEEKKRQKESAALKKKNERE